MRRNQKIPSLHDLQQTPLLDQKGSDPRRQIAATHHLLPRYLESGLQSFGQFGVHLHFLLNSQMNLFIESAKIFLLIARFLLYQ
jgi:hypothetical protein